MSVASRALPWLTSAAAVLLAAAAGWENSATTDEPYHLLASYAHVVEGKADLNSDKPPLTKLLAGLALAPLHLRGTEHPPVARLASLPEETRRFLYQNTRPPRTILAAARAPQLLFLVALLWGVHLWGRELWGAEGALLALVAVAAQPLLLGHAPLVQTDVAAAGAFLWALYALHRWVRGREQGWIVFGLLLGLALIAKFSCLWLIPVGLLLLLLESGRAEIAGRLLRFAFACALAILVALAGYAPALRHTTPPEEDGTITVVAAQWPGTERAARALRRLALVSPAAAHYGLGLLHVYETDRRGQGINYFLGKTTREGSWLYFPVALLVKLTVPFLALLVLTAVAKGRRWTRPDAFLLVPAGLTLLVAVGARYNIGARHVLPIVPLLALFGGQLAGRLLPPLRAALLVSFAVPPLLFFPHYISHFNLLAGGPDGGARILTDSNLDWGQDWLRLAERARREGWTPMTYVYVGTAFPGYDLVGARDFVNDPAPPSPGFYAVSSFAERVGPDYLAYLGAGDRAALLRWLLAHLGAKSRVVGRVGTTITVRELR